MVIMSETINIYNIYIYTVIYLFSLESSKDSVDLPSKPARNVFLSTVEAAASPIGASRAGSGLFLP